MVHYYLDDVLVKQLEQNLLSASEVQCFQDAAMRLEENVYNGKRAFVADINKMVRTVSGGQPFFVPEFEGLGTYPDREEIGAYRAMNFLPPLSPVVMIPRVGLENFLMKLGYDPSNKGAFYSKHFFEGGTSGLELLGLSLLSETDDQKHLAGLVASQDLFLYSRTADHVASFAGQCFEEDEARKYVAEYEVLKHLASIPTMTDDEVGALTIDMMQIVSQIFIDPTTTPQNPEDPAVWKEGITEEDVIVFLHDALAALESAKYLTNELSPLAVPVIFSAGTTPEGFNERNFVRPFDSVRSWELQVKNENLGFSDVAGVMVDKGYEF